MQRFLSFILALACFSLASPAFAEDTLKDVIQGREDAWSAAFNANDAAAIGAIYEEDSVLIPPGMEPVNGRAAIEEALSGFFAVLQDIKLISDDVRPMGEDYAVEVGRATYMAVGEDGSRTPTTDDFVVVWHKGEDGVWRYMTDIFNSR